MGDQKTCTGTSKNALQPLRDLNLRPTLTTDNTLDIVKGRHPLTELAVPGQFIPNDTCMEQDSNRVHVITGVCDH